MDRYLQPIDEKLTMIERDKSLHEDTIIALISLFRQDLEANKLQKKYKTIIFYANWSLHVSLDRSAQDILQQIYAVLFDGHETHYNDRLNEVLGLHLFRREIIDLLTRN